MANIIRAVASMVPESCSNQRRPDVPGSLHMHDDSELATLELPGPTFSDQPQCYQNMINLLRQTRDPYFNMGFDKIVNEYLAEWNLEFVRYTIVGLTNKGLKIQGNKSNLTAWMLSHA